MTVALPLLDVVDVLGDADFMTSFDVAQQVQTISDLGDATDTPIVTTSVNGVVYPDKARTLQRTANNEKQVESITIVTNFRLTVGTKTNDQNSIDADIVTWNGARYTVVSIKDWSQYGVGFIEATADLLDFVKPN